MFIELLADNEEMKQLYLRWHCKSFTDDNKDMQACPYVKECEYTAQRMEQDALRTTVINCLCGNSFCFACGEQQHRPADCKMYKEWDIKNSAESENASYILANCKICPLATCGKPFERISGCNHMVCP